MAPRKAPTLRDAVPTTGVVRSAGTHVVAVVTGEETFGYLPNLGDAKRGVVPQGRARRLDEAGATSLDAMWNAYAEKARLPERYEARPYDDFFAGAGA